MLHSCIGAKLIKDSNEAYEMFSVQRDNPLVKGKTSKLFAAKNKDYPTQPVICRIFKAKEGIDPKQSIYLKFLRHIAKKHGNLSINCLINYMFTNKL